MKLGDGTVTQLPKDIDIRLTGGLETGHVSALLYAYHPRLC